MARSRHAIRRATIDDQDAIAELFDQYRQFYKQPSDVLLARAFIKERILGEQSVLFVAENADRQLAGFCQLYPTFCSVAAAPIYVLYDLYVAPTSRGAGLGRALMLNAQAFAAANGAARMDLSTAQTNAAAQALYESLGWRRDNEFFAYRWTPKGR